MAQKTQNPESILKLYLPNIRGKGLRPGKWKMENLEKAKMEKMAKILENCNG
jgi:hypothetical protein